MTIKDLSSVLIPSEIVTILDVNFNGELYRGMAQEVPKSLYGKEIKRIYGENIRAIMAVVA